MRLAAADRFELAKILVIPSANPPHKARTEQADYEHRYRMVELACEADPRLEPSRLEQPRPDGGRHYSFDTIQRVKQEYEFSGRLQFIIGRDAFEEIHLWHRWQEVVREVDFIVVSRPGGELTPDIVPPGVTARSLDGIRNPASSSEIRHRIKMGGSIGDMVPAAVAAYIREHRLYEVR